MKLKAYIAHWLNFITPTAFYLQTGITQDEVKEITEAYPISLIGHLLLDTREFEFELTPTGRVKRNSFKEIK